MSEERRLRECHGKVGHESLQIARLALRRQARGGRSWAGCKLNVYRCRFCGHWHVGNKHPRSQRKGFEGD